MTSATAENAVQKAPSSLSPTSKVQLLAAAVSSNPGGDHHRLGHHPVIDSGLAVGGVEEHIREPLITERSVAKRATSVSRSAQIRDTSLLDIPASALNALTSSSTLRVEVPCR